VADGLLGTLRMGAMRVLAVQLKIAKLNDSGCDDDSNTDERCTGCDRDGRLDGMKNSDDR
jgi:hypothetical protein